MFPDIGAYAFLSDWETNALVALSGQAEWLCVPRPDSPSIFGALVRTAVSGQHLGNYPQAFTHLALIDAVTRLIELETTEAAHGNGP